MLYSGDPGLADADCRAALAGSGRGRLAIANPRTAPYGLAATQFLDAEGLAERFEDRLVTGENISQAMQFAVRGGARFGLLAAVQAPSLPEGGCRWPVPASLHEPIRQQAVLLQPGMHNAAARAFVDYLRDEAQVLIRNAGYEIDNE